MAVFFITIISLMGINIVRADSNKVRSDGRLLTVYDRGQETILLTQAETIRQALDEAKIAIDPKDVVEPSLDEPMVASDYRVNIYRARPVLIIDGSNRLKITTAYQTAEQIVTKAGLTLFAEDKVSISSVEDITKDGVGLQVVIERALPINLTLYGRNSQVRTLAKTVRQFLRQKNIQLDANDKVSSDLDSVLLPNQTLRIWREGRQVITIEEEIAFAVDKVEDADREISYRAIKTPGQLGLRQVSYEILIEDGLEVGRVEINSLVINQPVSQVEVVGIKGRYSTPLENQQITWDYLIAQGFSPVQTAGIMGNLMQEHRFQTSGDGLAQWIGGRRAKLYSRPEPNNIYTQLDFMMEELNTGYAYVQNNIRASSSLEAVVEIFQNQFERCNPRYCMQNQRLNYARNILATHNR